MTLQNIKTKSGKTIGDFKIPESLISNEPEIVQLVMESESMNDGEKQYWFNLSESMSGEQIEKLRDILTREKAKLAEIDAKYNPEPEDKAQALKRAKAKGALQKERREALRQKEAEFEEEEKAKQDSILDELENL